MKIFAFKSFIIPLQIFLFGFALFGYGSISFLISGNNETRTVTIPYRIIVLLLSIIISFFHVYKLTVLSKKQYPVNIKESNVKNKKFSWIPKYILICFVLVYSFKLLEYTVYNTILTKPPEEYQMYWFAICLIPAFSFLTVEYCQFQRYLLSSYFFVSLSCILSAFGVDASIAFIAGRLDREGLSPISVSNDGTSLVLLSFFILTTNRNTFKNKHWIYFLCFFAIFLGSFMALLGGSKGPIVSLSICLILNLIFAKYSHESFLDKKIIIVYILIVTTIIACITITIDSPETQITLLKRFYTLFEGDRSTSGRIDLIDEAISLIMGNPLFGHSIEVPGERYVHNLIIDSFLSTGIFGGLYFTVLYVYGIVKSIIILKNHYLQWGWLGMIYIQYSVSVMFSGSLYSQNIFWYLIFCLVALNIDGNKEIRFYRSPYDQTSF